MNCKNIVRLSPCCLVGAFQLLRRSNMPTKAQKKTLQILWIPWKNTANTANTLKSRRCNGDNFLSSSFHLHCAAAASWNPSALSEWEFEELWEAGPGLVQPCLHFSLNILNPQPFTTASMVIYGNPCGMQDGNSIFIENYQTEDLGASIHWSKPSLHLLDSFRLKSHHKTFEKF